MLLTCFFNSINKKTCASHMFKCHVSFLYVGCRKFLTNKFVENFCPIKNVELASSHNDWLAYAGKSISQHFNSLHTPFWDTRKNLSLFSDENHITCTAREGTDYFIFATIQNKWTFISLSEYIISISLLFVSYHLPLFTKARAIGKWAECTSSTI